MGRSLRRYIRTSGRWRPEEIDSHINYLELSAILLAVKALCNDCANTHIRVQCDTTTAVCCITSMGGSKSMNCNALLNKNRNFVPIKYAWLSAAHLPGCKNRDANLHHASSTTELNGCLTLAYSNRLLISLVIQQLTSIASRLNNQCTNYALRGPDPKAQFVNAFSVNWRNFFFYAFRHLVLYDDV